MCLTFCFWYWDLLYECVLFIAFILLNAVVFVKYAMLVPISAGEGPPFTQNWVSILKT